MSCMVPEFGIAAAYANNNIFKYVSGNKASAAPPPRAKASRISFFSELKNILSRKVEHLQALPGRIASFFSRGADSSKVRQQSDEGRTQTSLPHPAPSPSVPASPVQYTAVSDFPDHASFSEKDLRTALGFEKTKWEDFV